MWSEVCVECFARVAGACDIWAHALIIWLHSIFTRFWLVAAELVTFRKNIFVLTYIERFGLEDDCTHEKTNPSPRPPLFLFVTVGRGFVVT